MEFYEMETLIENMWMKNKDSWEQTRMMSYITAQTQSTKHLELSDIMTFPWEKNNEIHIDTQEELDSMMNEMKQYENKLNNK